MIDSSTRVLQGKQGGHQQQRCRLRVSCTAGAFLDHPGRRSLCLGLSVLHGRSDGVSASEADRGHLSRTRQSVACPTTHEPPKAIYRFPFRERTAERSVVSFRPVGRRRGACEARPWTVQRALCHSETMQKATGVEMGIPKEVCTP